MPAQKPERPLTRARQTAPVGGEPDAFSQRQISQAAQRAADQIRDRSSQVIDLIVGANVFNHSLGRRPIGAAVSLTVLDATAAWAMTRATASQVTITLSGAVPQPSAAVEVF